MNEAGTLVGVVSMIPEFGALADPPCRATRSAPGEHLRCG